MSRGRACRQRQQQLSAPGVEACVECLRDSKEVSVAGGESKREWGEQTTRADMEWHRVGGAKIMLGLPGHGKGSGLYLEAFEQRSGWIWHLKVLTYFFDPKLT